MENIAMTPSPVEFVKSLGPDEQDAVLQALVEAVAPRWGKGIVTLRNPVGKAVGYVVPPDDSAPSLIEMIQQMPADIREKMLGPLPDDLDLDDCMTDEELEELTERAIAEAQRSPLSSAYDETTQPVGT